MQGLRRDIELQLAQHKTNKKSKIQELKADPANRTQIEIVTLADENWRNNALKFLSSVERRMLYVKMLLQEEKEKD